LFGWFHKQKYNTYNFYLSITKKEITMFSPAILSRSAIARNAAVRYNMTCRQEADNAVLQMNATHMLPNVELPSSSIGFRVELSAAFISFASHFGFLFFFLFLVTEHLFNTLSIVI